MGQIGEELKRARELKGLSLRDAEEFTKIRNKYLAALESDNYDVIPGRVYVIGFLRTYAKYLGLDDDELVQQFKEISEPPEEQEDTLEQAKPISKPTKVFLIIALSAVALITLLAIFLILNQNKSTAEIPEPEKPSIQTPQGSPENPPSQPQEASGTSENMPDSPEGEELNTEELMVTVNIKKQSCWIAVSVDGKSNFQGTMSAGESRTFIGTSKIMIRYGNPSVAEVVYQGQTIYPVGPPNGQVVTREYTAKSID